MKIKVRQVVKYKGHSLSANGSVSLTLKSSYGELTNTIKVMQMLNNDVIIKAKLPGTKPFELGSFRVKQISIDGDGESTLKFNGLNDYVEMDALNLLPMNDEETKDFVILMETEVETDIEEEREND